MPLRSSPRPLPLVAAATTLALGHAAAAISLAVAPPPVGPEGASPWLFAAVWTILYPCFGVATVHVWGARARPAGPATLAVGLCALAVTLAFMPIACVAGDVWVTTLMDALAWVIVWTATWAYARVAPAARLWMLPLAAWMPVTFALKLAAALR